MLLKPLLAKRAKKAAETATLLARIPRHEPLIRQPHKGQPLKQEMEIFLTLMQKELPHCCWSSLEDAKADSSKQKDPVVPSKTDEFCLRVIF